MVSSLYYKVGEFARLIGVTTATLREWDRRDWLKPHHKSNSGYRYYTMEQAYTYLGEKGKSTNEGSG